MKEHPILFNDEMVRAILEGRKTQTRRIPKPSTCLINGKRKRGWPEMDWEHAGLAADAQSPTTSRRDQLIAVPLIGGDAWAGINPRVEAGDRLWVKESYAEHGELLYRADNKYEYDPKPMWKSERYMPHWASRITLEVTDVWFELLQDIGREDAIKEGVIWYKCPVYQTIAQMEYNTSGINACATATIDYRNGFATLWDSIYESKGWEWSKNRPVLVYEFKVIK